MNKGFILPALVVLSGSLFGQGQQSAGKTTQAQKMPPLHSTPKRDAAGPAPPEQKAAMKTALEKQFAAFRRSAAAIVHSHGPAGNVPEIQALERQKMAVASLRTQSKNASPAMLTKIPAPPANPTPA